MWLIILSDQLLIVALVSFYLTNQLIRRRPILGRLSEERLCSYERMRYCHRFLGGIPHLKVGTHVVLTRPPLTLLQECVRLACVRHAASVYPEPGSNSPFMCIRQDRSLVVCICLEFVQAKLLSLLLLHLAVRGNSLFMYKSGLIYTCFN